MITIPYVRIRFLHTNIRLSHRRLKFIFARGLLPSNKYQTSPHCSHAIALAINITFLSLSMKFTILIIHLIFFNENGATYIVL